MAKIPNELSDDEKPEGPASEIESEILGEIESARERWGETFELKLLLGNWGDTFDDAEMLEAIRHYNETGRHLGNALRAVDPRDADNTLDDLKRKKPAAP